MNADLRNLLLRPTMTTTPAMGAWRAAYALGRAHGHGWASCLETTLRDIGHFEDGAVEHRRSDAARIRGVGGVCVYPALRFPPPAHRPSQRWVGAGERRRRVEWDIESAPILRIFLRVCVPAVAGVDGDTIAVAQAYVCDGDATVTASTDAEGPGVYRSWHADALRYALGAIKVCTACVPDGAPDEDGA